MAQRRSRRRFTREYKAQAVQRVIESGRPLADIAAELDVSPGQLSQWRSEQLAAGSAEALAQKKADEAELIGPPWVVRVESLWVTFPAACGVSPMDEHLQTPIPRRLRRGSFFFFLWVGW